MKTVKEIQNATYAWNQKRWNAIEVKLLLEKGSFFKITREDYEIWNNQKDQPKFIHAYPGIENDSLKFILIDSDSDAKAFNNHSLPFIQIKDYKDNYSVDDYDFLESGTSGNIDIEIALKRVMRWSIMRESWIEDQIRSLKDNQVGLFRVFAIPFEDLSNSFNIKTINEIVVNIGLCKRENPKSNESLFTADLLLWSVSDKNKMEMISSLSSVSKNATSSVEKVAQPVNDMVYMCPPFGEDPQATYNLINP